MPLNNSSNINAQTGYPLNPYTRATSFSPTIEGTTTAGVGTYTTQAGWYTKVGDLVFVFAKIVWTAHTGSGNILVGNLPFTVSSLANYEAYGNLNTVNVTTPGGTVDYTIEFLSGQNKARPTGIRSNNTNVYYVFTTNGQLDFSGFYLT